MKRMIMTSILVAGVAANAQTGSTTKAKVSAKKIVAQTSTLKTAPAPATQTTTAATTTVAPAASNKWSGLVNVMPYATGKDVTENGSDTPYKTDYAVGVGYKLTSKLKAELIGAMTYSNAGGTKGKDSITDIDPAVKLGYKSDARLLGSEPIAFSGRYYVPVSTATVDRTNGTLRFDIASEWVLNPTWTFGTALSSRLYLNTNHKKLGSNSEIRLEPEVSMTYNLTDTLSFYATEALYTRSTDYLRGKTTANTANLASLYLGANYSAASAILNGYTLILNPFVEIDTDLASGKSTGGDVTYALNMIATF